MEQAQSHRHTQKCSLPYAGSCCQATHAMSDTSSQPLENPYILDLMPSFGAQIIGAAISTALWGVSCMQAYVTLLL